jgi:hypothetical protein
MLLVLMQPDLGTALTYTPILLAGLFLGGIHWKQAAILGTVGLVAIVGVWTSGKILKPYQKARLTSFINPDNDPARLGLPDSPVADRGGLGRESGARARSRGRRRRGIFAYPSCGLHFCGIQRGAWLYRRVSGSAAILRDIDAFDSERSNCRRHARHAPGYGSGSCVDLPNCGQRRHGHRFYASHRNSFTVNELRRIFGVVHLPGAGRGYERPNAPVCELGQQSSSTGFTVAQIAVAQGCNRFFTFGRCWARKTSIINHFAGRFRLQTAPAGLGE